MEVKNKNSGLTFRRILLLLATSVLAAVTVSPLAANAAGPNLISASIAAVSGRTITLSFDDLSGTSSQPPKEDFAVTGSTQGSIVVSSVIRSGNTLRVSVASIVMGNQTATLSYTPTVNVPVNAANEQLAGFTTPLDHPGGSSVPTFSTEELSVNMTNPSVISTWFNGYGLTCSLSPTNFQVKVNGATRTIASLTGTECGTYLRINLSSPLVANDSVTFSYIPSNGSVVSMYGIPAAALTNAKVYGIPDTIAPTVTVPSVSNFPFGQGGEINFVSNEPVNWQVSSDRTLSFQIFGTPQKLLVSSILPAGSYNVGLTAADDAGNVTTRSITVTILAAGATPSPTPTPIPQPTTTGTTKASVYKTCSLLNKKYPGGVASSYSSKNKGTGMYFIPRVDAALYKANIKLDKDKDGIACER